MNRIWSEAELAYFAGIIDGEGCFAMHKHREGRYGASVQIGNTDPQLMQWIHQRFGGSLNLEPRGNPKWQPVWRWVAASAGLDRLIQSLIPYLITKKRQAELFLAYRATLNTVAKSGARARGVGVSTARIGEDVKRERMAIHAELNTLKRPHLVA